MKRAVLLVPLPLAAACCPDVSYAPIDANFYVPLDGFATNTDAQCWQMCEEYAHHVISEVEGCELEAVDAGVASMHCTFIPQAVCGGRRPAEVVRGSVEGELAGCWLGEAAQLEAASVPAFEILARELAAHDAPPSLIARALASADDERRHARIMTSLARAHGATPGPVRVVVREPRALEAIAHENAVEGLVREAYGARVAIDPAIAADEQRHADLAADVHAWLRPRLPYAARLRVDEARHVARAQLVAECAQELPRAVRDTLGLPDATRAVELARAI